MTSAIQARRESEDGFTLIELLVVVIIIGILAAIAIPAFLNQRESAYLAAAESEARNAAIEVEAFFVQNDAYPGGETGATSDQASFEALPGVNLTATSTPVALVYARNAAGTAFDIRADHSLLTSAADACYQSDAGGIVEVAEAADTCP